MKASAIAPSNIAFIKYWGKRNEDLRIPANGSISMNLSNMTTTTTVEFSPEYSEDRVVIDKEEQHGRGRDRVIAHLDRIRRQAGISTHAKVVSQNNFPQSTGLSSSASGFAALTVAGARAAGLQLSEKELSILARQGSGSACRSIPGGFVEWIEGDTSDTSYAASLYPPDYWSIADVVVVVSEKKKEVSTTDGQRRVGSNPFFQTRLTRMRDKIRTIKEILKKKDFSALGEVTEKEAFELVALKMTSDPPILLIQPETVRLIQYVRQWRVDGLEVYFSLNTGQNVHLLVQQKDVQRLIKLIDTVDEAKKSIINIPHEGTQVTDKHLF